VRSHEEMQELLGAYALDGVDRDEAAAVEDHLRECPRCRAEVAEHRETAAFLAHAGTDAPADLWDLIAGAVDAPAVVPIAPRVAARPVNVWLGRATAVIAAAAVFVIALLVVEVRDQDRRIDRLGQDSFAAAMDQPGARVVHLDAGDTELPVVLASDGTASVELAALPTLAGGRTYQLWGASGTDLISVAVLGRNPGVVTFDADGYSALAITEERAPGVVRTERTPIASGSLA